MTRDKGNLYLFKDELFLSLSLDVDYSMAKQSPD